MAMMLDNNNMNSSSCEGNGILLLSLDSHKSVPAPFLTKTYQLVDDPNTDHIVSWGEDNTTFVVWRPPEFARDLLPNYFKHNNFSSFVRQLNTYGFRKIVPDRWEFANEFFKKGEKHLLCEIHRRKTSHPPQIAPLNHQHHPFYPYPTRVSISPPDSDEQPQNNHWCDSPPPLSSPTAAFNGGGVGLTSYCNNNNGSNMMTSLSEDNERLRRNNNMLVSELAHMRKLYNDIIYFVQNHVKPVSPTNTSFFLHNSSNSSNPNINVVPHHTTTTANFNGSSSILQKPLNQLIGFNNNNKQQNAGGLLSNFSNNSSASNRRTSHESSSTGVTVINEEPKRTKLFGVSLPSSKKRLHSEYNYNYNNNYNYNYNSAASSMDDDQTTNKTRLVLEKDDLGLNLMPPNSSC